MDLALAHWVSQVFAEKGVQLDAWQAVALWHACREAKETLLAPTGPKTHPVTVLGRGRRLVGGTVTVDVERVQVVTLDLDNTLWDIQPVIEAAERELHDYLAQHYPQMTADMPLSTMTALRA